MVDAHHDVAALVVAVEWQPVLRRDTARLLGCDVDLDPARLVELEAAFSPTLYFLLSFGMKKPLAAPLVGSRRWPEFLQTHDIDGAKIWYGVMMKVENKSAWDGWLFRLRDGFLILGGVVGLLWVSSYFFGFQGYRSVWEGGGSLQREEARWLVSNYGSIGLAWRSQAGELGNPLPAPETAFRTFGASQSAVHVHPEGFWSWHWIHYAPVRPRMMGSMRTGYGHLYLPYWMPVLGSGLMVLGLSMAMKRRTLLRRDGVRRPATGPPRRVPFLRNARGASPVSGGR